jgi:hypothetical protein
MMPEPILAAVPVFFMAIFLMFPGIPLRGEFDHFASLILGKLIHHE